MMRHVLILLALILASCQPVPVPITPDSSPDAAVTVDAWDRAGEAMALYCLGTPGPKTMTWADACRKLAMPDELGIVLAPIPVDCIAASKSKAEVKACKVRCD